MLLQMSRISLCLVFVAGTLMAQTADTAFLRAVLLPANEVPAINNAARGVADVIASAVRDPTGQIVSGSVDVLLRVTLPASVVATGLNLHNGTAGQSVPVALSTGLGQGNSRALQSGSDAIRMPIAVPGDNAAALGMLRSLFQDASKFYLNLTTNDQPNGLMRGQLAKAQIVVLMALMTSDSVVPATADTGTGFGQIVAIGTRDSSGNWTSGEVYLWTTASSSDRSAFTGFHIHLGQPGTTGAIGITGTVPPGAAPDPNGFAALGPLYTEIATNNTTQTGTFTNLFVNPGSLYVDLHTAQNPNGILRAQLRPTDSMTFPLVLDSANELVPPAVHIQMPATFTLYTLRKEDGTVAAGTVLSDIDLRFPGPEQVIGLYIHDAGVGTDGPISIEAVPDFSSTAGFGAWYGWSPPVLDVAALNDIVQNPQNHYVNLHSVSFPGGEVRAQLGSMVSGTSVTAVIAANLDKAATVVAPGELISIFGANLAKVPTDLSGWTGQQLPVRLNGARVTIGGKAAPVLYVSANQINAQAPVDLPAGVQTLLVDNGSGAGAPYPVNVAPAAPAIFFYPVAAVLRNANFSLVSAANPAHAGDAMLVFATGLGQTTPAFQTGSLVSGNALSQTTPVGVSVGGKAANVVYSIASPGFAGLYQVAFTVPAGVSGSVPLQLSMGGVSSNSVTIPVQ
jgi:uncharacterized protein (TIGR03437 family)